MVEKSKHYSDVMKKHFNKELVMTRKDNKGFKNSTKCWIYDNEYVDGDVEVRDHITTHKKCNIKVKLNHETPVVIYNLKKYDSHLIMQELSRFSLTIIAIPHRLEKYLSFNINNKLSFIDSFQFLSFSFDSLVKIWVKIILSVWLKKLIVTSS